VTCAFAANERHFNSENSIVPRGGPAGELALGPASPLRAALHAVPLIPAVPSAAAISGPKSTTSEDSHDQQMSSASASKIFQFGWGVQIPNTASLLVLDAIFYLVRGGIAWRALPADSPPHQTVYALFRRWTRARAWCRIYAALRERARLADGRGPVPTAAVIDSQTVRAADTVPTASSGYDGGKKIKGRKRHVAVDTAALREAFSTITLVWADAGYAGRFVRDARKLWDLAVAIVKRPTRPRASSCSTAAGSWNAPSPG
jgi:transposase